MGTTDRIFHCRATVLIIARRQLRRRIAVFVCNTPPLPAFVPAIGAALDLMAVGGVSNGKDAHAALSRGAKAVQIGSALMKEGRGVFARIQQELIAEWTAHETGA